MGYHGDRHGEATTKQQAHSWAVYYIKGTPAKLIGIIEAPDEQTAIARAMADTKTCCHLGPLWLSVCTVCPSLRPPVEQDDPAIQHP